MKPSLLFQREITSFAGMFISHDYNTLGRRYASCWQIRSVGIIDSAFQDVRIVIENFKADP
jgi:hypothetical protein